MGRAAVPGVVDTRTPSRGLTAFLLVVAALPLFVNLGAPALWDANEPLYAQPPKEVLEWPEGDFLAPTWNGRTYPAHPPLSTWITVPFYAVLGSTEFAGRLPMALAALLTLASTFSMGRVFGGRRTGLLATLVLAGTPRFWLFSRQLAGDVYFTTCLTAAFALVLPVWLGHAHRRRLVAANVVLGIGFLAKGPVILVLYAAGLLAVWFCARPRPRLRDLSPVSSVLVILLIGLPWFAYMAIRFDWFIEKYFGWYTFKRVGGAIGERPPWWYLQTLVGDGQPWIMLMPLALLRLRRTRARSASDLFPWVVAGAILLFFSIPLGKRAVYLLPIYPLLAIGVAPILAELWEGARGGLARAAGLGLGAASLVAAICMYLLQVNEPRVAPEIFAPLSVLALAGLLLVWTGMARHGRAVCAIVLAATLCTEVATAYAFTALNRFRPVPALATRIQDLQDESIPEPALIYRAPIHSLMFYLGRATEVARDGEEFRRHMGDAEHGFVLVLEKRLSALREAAPGYTFRELARGPELRMNFRRSVLGQGPSSRDLLLVGASRSGEFPESWQVTEARSPDPGSAD